MKRKSDGLVDRFKARLVTKRFNQREGLDYKETFSPVVKQPTVRIVISLSVQYDCEIKQLDVSNAFLHGHLQEQVFMQQPQGFEHPDHADKVCHLNKAIYGLKQATRAWYDMLFKYLVSLGFYNSLPD